MGKIFYFGTATFMMACAGICYGVYVLFRKVYKRLQKDRTDSFAPETWGILFVELSVGAELAISALFMNYRYFGQSQISDRIDAIYYGRYADFVVGPALLAGLLLLYFVQKNIRFFLISLFITGGTSLVVQYLFDGVSFYLNFDGFVGNLSTYAGVYPFFGGDYTNLAFRVFSFSVLVFISCVLCILFFRKVSVPFVEGLVLACLLVGIWGYNGLHIVEAEAVEKTGETRITEVLRN